MMIWDAIRRFSGIRKREARRPDNPRNKRQGGLPSLENRGLRMEQFEQRVLLSIGSGMDADEIWARSLDRAIARASNMDHYTEEALAETTSWVVGLSDAANLPQKATNQGADWLGKLPHLSNAAVWEFSSETSWQTVFDTLTTSEEIDYFYPLVKRTPEPRFIPNDPLFPDQWHLLNTGQSGGTPGVDANVVPAWDQVSGAGVVIAIVDDSLQGDHPDLAGSYRADLSYDFNDNDPDPSPVWFDDNHGTAVGGVAGANGDNALGVSGSAPDAELAGLRLISGFIADPQEAAALSYMNQEIDIYNNSWGYPTFLTAPGPLTLAAFEDGVLNGRGGLGSIYTWAGGNDREWGGNVNYDGYANSRFTIAVAAINENGVFSYYSTPGATLLISACSNGNFSGITTTDRTGEDGYNSTGTFDGDLLTDIDYTSTFGGTSSATPLVSGVIALMLEANPALTYRDVQHILVETAVKNDPIDPDWVTNAAGYHINHNYGFGAIDAMGTVDAAMSWENVLPENAATSGLQLVGSTIPDGDPTGVTATYTFDPPAVDDPDAVTSIEWVEVTFDADHWWPGDLEVVLTSPDGTESVLANANTSSFFYNPAGYDQWTFTSARHWGESPEGQWTLQVRDLMGGAEGTFNSWEISVYGQKLEEGPTPPGPEEIEIGPELVAVIPNEGNTIRDGDIKHIAPRELTLLFSEEQQIDPATLGAIQIVRSGGDDVLGNANDVVVQYGWIGIGERPNEVIVRFAETLPDDLYQLTITGSGDEPLANIDGAPFHQGEDQVIEFKLDLGAQIIAVVPQPTSRDTGGNLQQSRDTVEVYFNDDQLDEASAEDPAFYQLTVTAETGTTADDSVVPLVSVDYDPVANKAVLVFEGDLADYGTGAFRLRIGNEYKEIDTSTVEALQVGDSYDTAELLGSLGDAATATSVIISSSIEARPYDLQWPGAIDEPGHRELVEALRTEAHYLDGYLTTDDQYGVATLHYNFRDDYGFDPWGTPLHNLITKIQKDRAREIMEMYGTYLGIQVVETFPEPDEIDLGFVIVTGDMRAIDPNIAVGPGGVLGLAGAGMAILDNAEDWGTSEYGESWFQVAMHEIGHLLGFGHTYDMPPETNMGDNPDPDYYEAVSEDVFPGDHDIVHGRRLFRPDSNDVDLYEFTLDAAGVLSAETMAERLDDSSLLDSVLTLYDGDNRLLARNDDYYSEDSYVEVYLEPGTYYIAVSSTGNTQFDPRVAGSGIGGTTQGDYELRLSFAPEVGQHMVDTTGTMLDGDADGVAGGVYDFWFNVQPSDSTIFVDKLAADAGADGSLGNPYNNIPDALAAAAPGNIVRIVGNWDRTYLDQATYDVGQEPYSLALGDIDGDGWQDIVTANREESTITVLFGVGDGTFWNPATYDVGQTPNSVAIGDIDGDGSLDVVTANRDEDTVSILYNNGDGTLANHVTRFVADEPFALTLGDLNNDGTVDLITTSLDENSISVVLNNGDGTLADPVSYEVGEAPYGVALGDMDNDGTLDIAAVNHDDDTVSVLLGNGDGTFADQTVYDVGDEPYAVAMDDLDGDGSIDIVAANRDDDTVSVLMGNGDGTFATQVAYDVGDEPYSVALADLDRNGTPDIVTANRDDNTLSILFGLGDGTFEGQVVYDVGDEPTGLVLGDLDGDTVPDIITANSDDDDLSVLLGRRSVAYEIGFDIFNQPLADGWRMEVPQGVTVMIDAGAVLKLRKANIDVGSSAQGVDRSLGALQVLGTPEHSVTFTSFHDKTIGVDNAAFDLAAVGGDWGGLVFRNNLDYDLPDERIVLENEGIFLNYVNHAEMRYGGGPVAVNSIRDVYNPIHIVEARPTVSFNTIIRSADAAMSADPNSFADTKFQDDTYTADYDRVGPDIHGNYLVENSVNGIFVRIQTEAGKAMDELEVAARWDDLDIVHVVAENLIVGSTPGGPTLDPETGELRARTDARLTIDPGIYVKLEASRFEVEMGAQVIAEGRPEYPIIFTSVFDDRYGAGGTFDTTGDADATLQQPGDWGGLFFGPVSHGSIDNALIAHAGGPTPIEGRIAQFNPVEIHQAFVRLTNSTLEDSSGGSAGDRNGRSTITDSIVFVRGAQPIIAGNIIRDNTAPAISINANALQAEYVTDWGLSRSFTQSFEAYPDNHGPLVRENRLANNDLNGMVVRGAVLTTASVWDDADIVHILQDEIVVPNHHTFSGLRLQSSADESLVVKLFGDSAGLTALGTPQDIDDRIGGTLQIVGTPGHPVVLTSLADDAWGAGLDPWGLPQDNTDNADATPAPADWRSVKLERYVNDRNVEIVNETEAAYGLGGDPNGDPTTAQLIGALAPHEKGGDDNLRLGFEVHGFIRSDDSADMDVYSFHAEAGSEVWLDIDRTTLGLDSIVELVDADGNVLARSDNSPEEQANVTQPYGLGRTMDKDVWQIDDHYTTNPLDAGMRLILPGPVGQQRTYYVRVRSADGQSSGAYQLHVRLRELQELAGSTIRMASINYATTGIELLGLPTHSPLLGETIEADTDNNTFGNSQYIGNLVDADRSTIEVGGYLDGQGDIDWYSFTVDLDKIDGAGGIQWPTVFDIDYADGMARADTAIWVFDSVGNLIYCTDDANVADDRPGPMAGSDIDDLTRGTVGSLDPLIGPVLLPEGDGMTYYVAVTTYGRFSNSFNQAMLRREPVNSIKRIAEDRLGDPIILEDPDDPTNRVIVGGQSLIPESPTDILFPDFEEWGELNVHVDDYQLNDVILFIGTQGDLYTVNPFTGEFHTDLTGDGAFLPDVAAWGATYGDIVMRNDGRLYTFISGANIAGDLDPYIGRYRQLSTEDGSLLHDQDDGIITYQIDPDDENQVQLINHEVGVHFEAIVNWPDDPQRQLFAVGYRDEGNGVEYLDNIMYRFFSDGTAAQLPGTPSGERLPTDIVPWGHLQSAPYLAAVAAEGAVGGDLEDGMTFSITDTDGTTITFEFDCGPDVRLTDEVSSIRDGHTFALGNDAITQTFEFDSGPVLVVSDFTQIQDGDTFSIRDSDDPANTIFFELDTTGDGVATGNEEVDIRAALDNDEAAQIIADAINAADLSVTASITDNRITLAGDDIVNAAGISGLDLEGASGVAPGNVRVPFEPSMSDDELLQAVVDAVTDNLSGVDARFSGDRMTFHGASGADVSGTPAFSLQPGSATGVAGANQAVVFHAGDSATDVATAIADAINAAVFSAEGTAEGAAVHLTNVEGAGDLDLTGTPLSASGGGTGGQITGMAFVGDTLYAVDDAGGLYTIDGWDTPGFAAVVPTPDDAPPNIEPTGGPTLQLVVSSLDDLGGIPFSGLTVGPTNVEGGFYGDLLFATDEAGTIWAFNTDGELQSVFLDGAASVDTGLGAATGIAFSNVDYNLWHITDNRGGDPGHGTNVSPDQSRTPPMGYDLPGANSFWFGFEDSPAEVHPGSPNYRDQSSDVFNTYDVPGGTHGTLTTDLFSLRGYEPIDQPVVYFDYFLETEGSNLFGTDQSDLFDSARVFISNDGVQWDLVASNIEADEVMPLFDGIDSWLQCRLGLSAYAGLDTLRLKFEFSTPGTMNIGENLTAGAYLRALPGNELHDGETFVVADPDAGLDVPFEFDMGFSLVAPNSAGQVVQDGEWFSLEDATGNIVTFEYVKDAVLDSGDVAIYIGEGDSAFEVARATVDAINTAVEDGLLVDVTAYLKDDRVYLNLDVMDLQQSGGAAMALEGDAPGTPTDPAADPPSVLVPIDGGMTAAEVAEQIAVAIDGFFSGPAGPAAGTDLSDIFTSVKQDQDLLHMIYHTVPDSGPLAYDTMLPGDLLPIEPPPGRFFMPERGQNNRHEGFYIDDVIIGFVERGEMITGQQPDTTFGSFNPGPTVTEGYYQLEIRRASEYGVPLVRSWDTNDRHMSGITIAAPAAGQIVHGQSFTINDGVNTQSFQFVDSALGSADVGFLPIEFASGETAAEVANNIVDAINAATEIEVTAASIDTSDRVDLVDAASVEGIDILTFDHDGQNPTSAAIADFNGDDLGDFVTTNSYDGTLSVLLGKPDALRETPDDLFYDAVRYQAGPGAADVEIGDVNADGILDLVTANAADHTVSVLLGNGDGTFEHQVVFQVGHTPVALTLADMDADGLVDIITANKADNTVSILAGLGNGMFAEQETLPVGPKPMGVAADDLDGNGMPDIVTANSADNTVSVILEVGGGAYAEQVTYDVGRLPAALALGDLNSDGAADIVTADRIDGTVSVLLGDGAGGFGPAEAFDAWDGPVDVKIADLDGDDVMDLVVANFEGDHITSITGNGDGTFQDVDIFSVTPTGTGPMGVAAADIDGDDNADVITANYHTHTASVLLNMGGRFRRLFPDFHVGLPFMATQQKGDQNTHRDQGQTIIEASEILNSAGYGIVVDAGARDSQGAELPHPGSVAPLREINTERLVPGVTIRNNLLVASGIGGILFSGDENVAGTPQAAVPFGRIINNTIYGGTSGLNVDLLEPGDLVLPPNDDEFSALLPMGFDFDFYDNTFNQMFINNNGNVTFTAPLFQYTPDGFPQPLPIVAPFWADVDTRNNGGEVRLALGTSNRGNPVIQVDWVDVGYYNMNIDKRNTFTLYIEDDPGGDIVLFVYHDMQWTTGDIDGTGGFGGEGAQIGFDAGNMVNYVSLARPTSPEDLADLMDPGWYMWRIDPASGVPIGGGGMGISVTDNASPTILNNIFSFLDTGVLVDATSGSTVLDSSAFQNNGSNTNGIAPGSYGIELTAEDPLFVDPVNGNFYLAHNSQAIDSSIDSLEDRHEMVTVREPLGILESPILAPDTDLLGQLRSDDPTIAPPPGLGANVFKDRGAIDRVDFLGPDAGLIVPLDNDSQGLDRNPGQNDVLVLHQDLTEFAVQLTDLVGIGIDDHSVVGSTVTLYRDYRGPEDEPLEQGTDYFFRYNPATDVITLVPASGIWAEGSLYSIFLDNTPGGIRDMADNPLRPNRIEGTTMFTIGVTYVDFGDAPDPAYPSRLASDGARHLLIGGYWLGEGVSAEADARYELDENGQPIYDAGGDSFDDGVAFHSALLSGGQTAITVTASRNDGFLDAWIDYNLDGDWDDPGERIFAGEPLEAGENEFSIPVPAGLTAGTTYARFRYSSTGNLDFFGEATDGEVEDYQLDIVEYYTDFGDAPESYLTTRADDGPRHVLGSSLFLGVAIDPELDGQPNSSATGDDLDADGDDEDGVVFNYGWLQAGQPNAITVTASQSGYLNAWLDFNRDGQWTPEEKVFDGELLQAGANSLELSVPADAELGTTFARFRLSSVQSLEVTGEAPDGEVEDYAVLVTSLPRDFGDAPDSYPTAIHGTFAELAVQLDGDDNDLLFTAATAGRQFNDIDIYFTSRYATGNEAIVEFNEVAGRLTIDIDRTATTAATLVAAVNLEGTFTAALDTTTEPDNDGTGLVAVTGLQGRTAGALDGAAAASHVLGFGLYLGAAVDAELDGHMDPEALGDDNHGIDDEDGVEFADLIIPGQQAQVLVDATYDVAVTGYLNAWIDFNADGVWSEDEQVVFGEPLPDEPTALDLTIPIDAVVGTTFARFRFSSRPDLSFDGPAPDGEVEDYQVEIVSGTAMISGWKFNDLDNDRRQDYNEPGIAGVTVYLDLIENGILDRDQQGNPIEPVAVTMEDDLATTDVDETGYYEFSSLFGRPQPYIVREVLPDGWIQTYPNETVVFPDGSRANADGSYSIFLEEGELLENVNFGNYRLPYVSISDVAVAEGDYGVTEVEVTLTLTDSFGAPVTVDYYTQDGSATLADNDYEGADGSFTFPARQAPLGRWEATVLTSNSSNDYDYHVSGDYVVWEGHDGNDWETYLFDGTYNANGDPVIQQLTDNEVDDRYASVFDTGAGPHVVWSRDDGDDWEVFFYNGGTTIQLTDNNFDDRGAEVSGSHVIWLGNTSSDSEVFLYDIEAGDPAVNPPVNLSDNNFDDFSPRIAGSSVVWSSLINQNLEIYVYDGTEVRQVTHDPANDLQAQIDGNNVVWERQTTNGYEIFLYQVDTSTTTQLTFNFEDDRFPQVSGSDIVWQGYDGMDYEIFHYNTIVQGTPTNISNNPIYEEQPQISGDRVVWRAYDGFIWEVYSLKLRSGQNPVNISQSYADDWRPQVSDSMIAWRSYDGNDYEILVATQAPPEVTETLTLRIVGDRTIEADESFLVHIEATNPDMVLIAQDSAEIGILNDDGDLDYGDVPDPGYPTLLASAGARHLIVPGFQLGQLVDFEGDGQPSEGADRDDTRTSDDEDGVEFLTTFSQGAIAEINVVASAAGRLDAWFDFNADGDWDDPGEQVFADELLAAGNNTLSVPVPVTATVGPIYTRFRFSSAGGLKPTGFAWDGEVEDYRLEIEANPIATGRVLNLVGTDGDDTFEFIAGEQLTVIVNGAGYQVPAAEIDEIRFDGLKGHDTVLLRGSDDDETVEIWPDRSVFLGPGYSVLTENVESITAFGGKSDEATLHDSEKDDVFIATPEFGEINSENFFIRAESFGSLVATSTNGSDWAYLYDSTGDDYFKATPQYAQMTGPEYGQMTGTELDFSVRAESFRYVYGIANRDGVDTADLYDSPGDDLFTAHPEYATMTGEGFHLQADGFERAIGNADEGGVDTANLYDSEKDDNFTTTPDSAKMFNYDPDDPLYLFARNFRFAKGYATAGGHDIANMNGSSGDDTFLATPDYAKLFGENFYDQAVYFEAIRAFGEPGGNDVAQLHDSAGDDTFIAGPNYGKMLGEGYKIEADYFRWVTGYGNSGGDDVAELYDSVGDDTLVVTPIYAKLFSDTYYNRAYAFETVNARADADGHDEAYLNDSALADLLEADDDWARLSNTELGFSYWVARFEYVEAVSTSQGDRKDVDPAVDFLFARGLWEDM